MADYIEIEQAIEMPGLRLVLIPGLPGPWGEAAKGIFHVKKVPFVRVRHKTGDPDYLEALKKWTGQTSYPVAAYNNERPRTTWTDILFLAERIAPQPPLIPSDAEERALMFGYGHELCGELGLSWCQRLMLLDGTLSANAAAPKGLPIPNREAATQIGSKYGYDPANAAAAPTRIAQIVRLFASRLAQQRAGGRRFLVGDQLSALDIYWATFISRIQPLQQDLCPMPAELSASFIQVLAENPLIKAAMDPMLLAHRDFVYRNYLELPVDL
jgi:glutathione S-transferase